MDEGAVAAAPLPLPVTGVEVEEAAEPIHLEDRVAIHCSNPFFFSGSGVSVATSGQMIAGKGGLVACRLEPTVTNHISRRGLRLGTGRTTDEGEEWIDTQREEKGVGFLHLRCRKPPRP